MTTSNKSHSFTSRITSFKHAYSGLRLLWNEPNVRLHALAATAVVFTGIVRHVNRWQWAALIFAVGLVWTAEAINTCIEKLADFACDHKLHPSIKVIKDISAAAVLVAAFTSVAIAAIVFLS